MGARGSRDRGTSTSRSRLKNPEDHELRWGEKARRRQRRSVARCRCRPLSLVARSGSSFGSNTTQWISLSIECSRKRKSRRTFTYFHSAVRGKTCAPTERGSRRPTRQSPPEELPRSGIGPTRLQKCLVVEDRERPPTMHDGDPSAPPTPTLPLTRSARSGPGCPGPARASLRAPPTRTRAE